jgi:hypothetical protein
MNSIKLLELPQTALLSRYKQQGAYTDCYSVEVPRVISHSEYIETFYTTPLFKVERFILATLVSRPNNLPPVQSKRLRHGVSRGGQRINCFSAIFLDVPGRGS